MNSHSNDEIIGSYPSLARVAKNVAETDLNIGLKRMNTLIPYACARLGEPLPPAMTISVSRSFREDIEMLCSQLALGRDKLCEFYNLILTRGVSNVRPEEFLKRSPGGGKGKCKLNPELKAHVLEAIEHVCIEQGLTPGSRAANKAIHKRMLIKGAARRVSPRALKTLVTSPEVVSAHSIAKDGDHICRVVDIAHEALRATQVILLDATQHSEKDDPSVCIYVLDALGRVMGLLNVIYGVDGATRRVWTALGFVGAPNSFLAALAIHRGLICKDALFERWGLDGKYLLHGKPALLVTDQGGEFLSKDLAATIKHLGIGFHDRCPKYTPTFRAKGERFNRTAQNLFSEFIRSDVSKKYLRPVSTHPEAVGILFGDIDRALFDWLSSSYDHRPHKGLGGDTPWQRFLDMAHGRKGFPLSGLPVAVQDRDDLMWDFLWKKPRIINHVGITIDSRLYTSADLSRYLAPGKRSSIRRVDCRYNPYALGRVFVKDPLTRQILGIPYVHCNERNPMTEAQKVSTLNCSIWEWKTARTDLRRIGDSSPTPARISEVIVNREVRLTDPLVPVSKTLNRKDVANYEMRKHYAPMLPQALDASPCQFSEISSKTSDLSLMPIGVDGADEY